MTTPFLALFAFFFIAPLVYSMVLSLDSPLTGTFVGAKNYMTVFGDSVFWSSVWRMVYFGLIQVTAMIILSVLLALLLDSPYCRGKRAFTIIFFLPYAVPGVIAAIMWAFLLEPDLNSALNIPHTLGLTAGPITPLDYRLVLYAMMLIVTWEFTGYNTTILITSLGNVSPEIIEAARIDGASELTVAMKIKLPLLRRTLLFISVLSIIGTLQLFNEPVILSDIAAIGNDFSPNQIVYNTAFSFGNQQLAAAESVVLALITIVGATAFFGISRRRFAQRTPASPAGRHS